MKAIAVAFAAAGFLLSSTAMAVTEAEAMDLAK
jgi:hypothetical protein